MAGAMPSTLCAASKKVSAQGKRKWTEAKPKPPTKSDLLYITKSANERNKKFTHAYP